MRRGVRRFEVGSDYARERGHRANSLTINDRDVPFEMTGTIIVWFTIALGSAMILTQAIEFIQRHVHGG